MTNYVSDTKAAKQVSAWVILNKRGVHVATVKAHWGASRCTVNVHDEKAGFQRGTASGYGYDKFTAALSGLSIDGHAMSDHCDGTLKRPKRGFFPANYKAPKGFSLANYGTFRADTGARMHSYHWRDLALADWRAVNPGEDPTDWESQIARHSRVMASEAAERGETVSGWQDCYRESGLKYLQALGYRVIQAI
jgi:hypothetical protein